MVAMRNWPQTLWRASFKGLQFWVDRDQETGGRRIVKHQFPMRDPPFLEDLGEDLREFDITAYLASETADSEASALSEACATRGLGALVLPLQGSVTVQGISFSRDFEKSRLGYVAFNLKCTRAGAASAVISVLMQANQIFQAADNMVQAVAAAFSRNLQTVGQPDFVTAGAASGVQEGASALEAVRTTETVEAVASAAQRAAIEGLYDTAAALIDAPGGAAAAAGELVTIARALGDGMDPAAVIRAFSGVLDDYAATPLAPTYPTVSRRALAINEAEAARALRLAAITAYCEAIARVKLTDRAQGITLRANAVEFFEAETDNLPPTEYDLVAAIGILRDTSVAYLSTAIIDLAPVLKLETNVSLPSLFLAYRLYQDAGRALELVERNRVAHPSFMPAKFEALAK